MKKVAREQGDGAVIHGNAGHHPANVTNEAIRKKMIDLKMSDIYRSANFTYFRELLLEWESIRISYTALCRMLKAIGISSKRTHRAARSGFPGGKSAARLANSCKPTRDWFRGW